jgi:hypothetical protein
MQQVLQQSRRKPFSMNRVEGITFGVSVWRGAMVGVAFEATGMIKLATAGPPLLTDDKPVIRAGAVFWNDVVSSL